MSYLSLLEIKIDLFPLIVGYINPLKIIELGLANENLWRKMYMIKFKRFPPKNIYMDLSTMELYCSESFEFMRAFRQKLSEQLLDLYSEIKDEYESIIKEENSGAYRKLYIERNGIDAYNKTFAHLLKRRKEITFSIDDEIISHAISEVFSSMVTLIPEKIKFLFVVRGHVGTKFYRHMCDIIKIINNIIIEDAGNFMDSIIDAIMVILINKIRSVQFTNENFNDKNFNMTTKDYPVLRIAESDQFTNK